MKISQNTSVGELVKLNFRTASIFQEKNIDYCCGGDKTISEMIPLKDGESLKPNN